MTKTNSHWFRMVYIEVQDKKLMFGMKKMSHNLFRLIGIRLVLDRSNSIGTQSIELDWYSIDRKSHISKNQQT